MKIVGSSDYVIQQVFLRLPSGSFLYKTCDGWLKRDLGLEMYNRSEIGHLVSDVAVEA